MAESLLFSLAESFIGKLASRAVEEASLALGVYDDLRQIRDTVSLIKAVLLDAEQKQQQNHELREWLRQIKRVLSNAEDVIDDFECEALRKRVVNTSGSTRIKVVLNYIEDTSQELDRIGPKYHTSIMLSLNHQNQKIKGKSRMSQLTFEEGSSSEAYAETLTCPTESSSTL